MTESIRVALNGTHTEIADRAATTTLLDWLRLDARLTGTKEGCAEGDCGACTVVLERLEAGDHVARSAVNSCITMLGQIDGLGVRTVEGVASPGGDLHPLQATMMSGGGTQCGFCTPGFIMAGYAFLADKTARRDLASIHDALAGNLCRCTGYRPIVAAMQEAAELLKNRPDDPEPGLVAALRSASRSSGVCFQRNGQKFFAPRSWAEALELRAQWPEATILSGGTDVGLLVSRKRQHLPLVIYLGNVAELARIEDRGQDVALGAAVTYAKALEILVRHYPTLRTYLTRLGSDQIRNMGTLGGNLGTASPIGDTLPVLLALGATLRVASHARGRREIAADDFFQAYRKTALEPDELIEAIVVPKPAAEVSLFVDKISKRRDQDISTVCAACKIVLQGDVVRDVRLAFGGMAPVPKRAPSAERALRGRRLDLDAADAAGRALMQDFAPLSDWRGSAEYRLAVARNLMRRLYWRAIEPSTTVELDEVSP
jgi:xanthine dehydrogenase small subunit